MVSFAFFSRVGSREEVKFLAVFKSISLLLAEYPKCPLL